MSFKKVIDRSERRSRAKRQEPPSWRLRKKLSSKGVWPRRRLNGWHLSGVTHGAIDWHFENKVRLFLEVFNSANLTWPSTDDLATMSDNILSDGSV